MARNNPKNERIKRSYFLYLREARRRNDKSVDEVAKALSRFEEATGYKDLSRFHREQAVAFKRKLDDQISTRTGERLSRATVHSTLSALRSFFIWLADQPGYKRRIRYSDPDYFNLAEKDVRIAKAVREKPFPTLEQVHHVLSTMPSETDVQRRDRGLIAFSLLTGARDGALASIKLKHVDLAQGRLDQDAREVNHEILQDLFDVVLPGRGVTPFRSRATGSATYGANCCGAMGTPCFQRPGWRPDPTEGLSWLG